MDQTRIIILSLKSLRKNLKKQFNCLGVNNEKYITFAVPIEKEVTKVDKNVEEITKKYILHITIY